MFVNIFRKKLEADAFQEQRLDRQQLYRSHIPRLVSEERDWVAQVVTAVRERIGDLLTLCVHLAEQPILVPSGQEKPRVRVRYITHPQRSYQDVQNELAVQLANLPRFTIFANIHGEQHLLRVSPPIETKIDEQRIARIRWVSKAKFGRRPPESPPAPPPKGTPPPPAGPGISRLRPGEE